jgi:hypothetical protein
MDQLDQIYLKTVDQTILTAILKVFERLSTCSLDETMDQHVASLAIKILASLQERLIPFKKSHPKVIDRSFQMADRKYISSLC